MNIVDKIAEGYIREAMENGEFDNLSTAGKSLQLDDDSMVPKELRAGYRLLKNSGHLPPELSLRKEISEVESLIEQVMHEEHIVLSRRLAALRLQLSMLRGEGSSLLTDPVYVEKLQRRFEG